jgi:hypothetical protein
MNHVTRGALMNMEKASGAKEESLSHNEATVEKF